MSIKYKKSDGSIVTIPTGSSSEWFGTTAELEEQFDSIPNGTKINILDDDDGSTIQKEINELNKNLTAAINDTNTAVNELNENLTIDGDYKFKVGKDGDGNVCYYGADGSLIPFKSNSSGIELLWKGNQNISSWSGGLIDVDLSNYQGLIVYGYAYNGAGDKDCSYINLNNIINNDIVFIYIRAYAMRRKFTINDNKITFASEGKYPAGSEFNVATSGTNYAIPCEIYGVPK